VFDFSRLIVKHSTSFTVIEETEGHYDQDNGGVWVPGTEQESTVTGAVLPLSSDELRYDQNGTYATADRKIYIYTELKKGQRVIHNGKEYTIHEDKNYSPQAGVYIYYAKRVGGADD